MNRPFKLLTVAFVALMLTPLTQMTAQEQSLPLRETARPETTSGVPHVQIGVEPVLSLSEEMKKRVAEFPGVTLGPTRVSLPGALGFQLARNLPLARPEVIVGGREFAHVHKDGSLHASLDPALAREAVTAGWAISHPWANRRSGWEGFVMIYTPVNKAELEVVMHLLESSYEYVTGRSI